MSDIKIIRGFDALVVAVENHHTNDLKYKARKLEFWLWWHCASSYPREGKLAPEPPQDYIASVLRENPGVARYLSVYEAAKGLIPPEHDYEVHGNKHHCRASVSHNSGRQPGHDGVAPPTRDAWAICIAATKAWRTRLTPTPEATQE